MGSKRVQRLWAVVLVWLYFCFGLFLVGAEELQKVPNIGGSAIPSLPVASALERGQSLALVLSLPLRAREELEKLVQDLSSPSSAKYRRYLSPEEFTARFGPTREEYERLVEWASANQLKVKARHPNRLVLGVEGTVEAIERAFQIRMHTFQHPRESRAFYAPDSEPSLRFAPRLNGVVGLSNYALPRPHFQAYPKRVFPLASANAGDGPYGSYAGKDFRSAYLPQTMLTGSGQSIALVEFDGYNLEDISHYANRFGLPLVPLRNVLLEGFSGKPTGGSGEVEVCLDIQLAMAMAPGASIVVYQTSPTGSWHQMLNRIATDNLCKQISCSWYSPGAPADPVADQIFLQMAAQGQSFFAASGDFNAYTGLIPFPCDSPYVTQVGGSTLITSDPEGAWIGESVWNWGDGPFGSLGGGGGISTQYSIPYWQQGIHMGENQGSLQMRNIPDVAMVADNIYVRAQGRDYRIGGTSCAAPLWAALTALVNELAMQTGAPAGFLNPSLYALGLSANYPSHFHDTVTGNNFSTRSPDKFAAVPGYDLCTGLGTPAGERLVRSLAGTQDPLEITLPEFHGLGDEGGPFTPGQAVYTLYNRGSAPLEWNARTTRDWLALSASSGVLQAGASAEVTVSWNDTANALSRADYSSAVLFTNQLTGLVQSSGVSLSIREVPPQITSETGASGIQGIGFNYQITTNSPAKTFQSSGLPSGLRLNATTGFISGVPTRTGTFPVTLVAFNPAGSGTATLTLTVRALPLATTGGATGVSTNVATLRAAVDPNGFATTAWFECAAGVSFEGALVTKPISMGAPQYAVDLVDVITGLRPSTRYYYRVNASNEAGARVGHVLSFVTPAVPLEAAISLSPIQNITASGAAISARVNPKGSPATVYFEYGLSTEYGTQTAPQPLAGSNQVSYVGTFLRRLGPGTNYHFRAVVTSALGTFYGPDETFTTLAETGLFAVASKHDVAPGIPNACFTAFGSPALNDSGRSAFQAFVAPIPGTAASFNSTNNSGIWAETEGGELALVVRTGEDAPGIPGSRFTALGDPALNNNHVLAFHGTARVAPSGAVDSGVWIVERGIVRLVARTRDQAPGCPRGTQFLSFAQIVLPDQGGVVVLANLMSRGGSGEYPLERVEGGNNQGIWAVDTLGALKLVVREGDTHIINSVPKVIAGVSIFAPARFTSQRASFNQPGDLIYKVRFTDGSQTIEKAVFP